MPLVPVPPLMLDFRALRFPGLISAYTLPSGGTSDYGPEMLHAAAQAGQIAQLTPHVLAEVVDLVRLEGR